MNIQIIKIVMHSLVHRFNLCYDACIQILIKQTYLIMPVVFLGEGYGENEKDKTRHSQEDNGDDKW